MLVVLVPFQQSSRKGFLTKSDNKHTHTQVQAKTQVFYLLVTFVAEGVWVLINWKNRKINSSKIKLCYKILFCVNCEPNNLIYYFYLSDKKIAITTVANSLRCAKDILTHIIISLTYHMFNNQRSCLANYRYP